MGKIATLQLTANSNWRYNPMESVQDLNLYNIGLIYIEIMCSCNSKWIPTNEIKHALYDDRGNKYELHDWS